MEQTASMFHHVFWGLSFEEAFSQGLDTEELLQKLHFLSMSDFSDTIQALKINIRTFNNISERPISFFSLISEILDC